MTRPRAVLAVVIAGMLLVAGCTGGTGGASGGEDGPFLEDGTHPQDPGDESVTDTIHYDNGTTRKVTYDTEAIEQHLFELINEFRADQNAGKAG